MIALFVNDEPELISKIEEVDARIKEIKEKQPSAEIEKRDPVYCRLCSTAHFYERDADFCGCRDY